VKNFEDFVDFCLASSFILKNFGLSMLTFCGLAKPQKFYHENFFLKQKSLNLKNFSPQKF